MSRTTAATSHSIKTLSIDLTGTSHADIDNLRQQIVSEKNNRLLPIIDGAFSKVCPADTNIAINVLTIDLGNIDRSRDAQKFYHQLSLNTADVLQSCLDKYELQLLWSQQGQDLFEKHVPLPHMHIEVRNVIKDQLLLLTSLYLRYGLLPWWAADVRPHKLLQDLLGDMTSHRAQTLRNVLRYEGSVSRFARMISLEEALVLFEPINAPLNHACRELLNKLQVSKLSCSIREIAKTIIPHALNTFAMSSSISSFYDKLFKAVAERLPPIEVCDLKEAVNAGLANSDQQPPQLAETDVDSVLNSSSAEAERLPPIEVCDLKEAVNAGLANSDQQPPQLAETDVDSVLNSSSAEAERLPPIEVCDLKEAVNAGLANSDQQPPQLAETDVDSVLNSSLDKNELEMILKEGIAVCDAGLVLLCPFISNYFEKLELLDNEGMIILSKTDQALRALHYLTHREQPIHEYQLALKKLLCGLDIDISMELPEHIESSISKVAEDLLIAAIDHWSALGKTTVSGFRETFLNRDATLIDKSEYWYLKVERKGVDVLLDNLPWSISVIKLPWMLKRIHVEW